MTLDRLELLLLRMNPSVGHSLELEEMMLEGLLGLEHSLSTDQLLMVHALESEDCLASLLETPYDAPACWADPVELVEIEDASMSLNFAALEQVGEGLQWMDEVDVL